MPDLPNAGDVARQARRAAHEAAPWVVRLARLGYASRGVVYVVVGMLAARAAMGERGHAEGTEGALGEMLRAPGGRALLGVVALGLAGYALWRFVQAGLDPERKGADAGGIAKRLGYALSGALHAGLALTAARMALGGGRGGGGDGAGGWTAWLMAAPAGRWLVGLLGLGFLAFGAYQLRRAATSDLAKRLDLSRLALTTREWAVRAARAGVAARGVVFGVIGVFLVLAGVRTDPGEARGVQGALDALREQPYGPWLLGAVAVGLAAYGLFEIVKARYRRIQPPR